MSGLIVAGALILTVAPVAIAQRGAPPPRPPAATTITKEAPKPIKYVKRGLPVRRVGVAVRAPGESENMVHVLAPHDHVAQTLSATPVVFWVYMGDSTDATPRRATITVSGGRESRTLPLEPARAWVPQRIDFERLGVELRPGVEYSWSVRVTDATQTGPQLDGASIRIAPDSMLARVKRTTNEADTAIEMAENGIWYDAFAVLVRGVSAGGSNVGALRSLRDALLREELNLQPMKW